MRKTIATFIIIALLAGIIRGCLGVLSHNFFWDEFGYADVAQRILEGRYSMGYERIPGWSYLIAFFNFFFDSANMMGIYLNIGLSSLTVALSYLLFRNFKTSSWIQIAHVTLWLFSIKHILWSRAGETNISSLFFVTLFWVYAFEYWNKPSVRNALILGVVSTLAITMRIENGLLLIVVAFVLWTKRMELPVGKVWVAFIFPFLLIKPIFYSLQFYSAYNWTQLGTQGEQNTANYSIVNIIPNIYHSSRFIFEIFNSPALWIICAVGALSAFFTFRKYVQAAALFFVLYFLAYFAGWLTQMGPDKVFIVYLPIFFSLGAYGIHAIDQRLRHEWSAGRAGVITQFLLSLLLLLEFMPDERIYIVLLMGSYLAFELIRKKMNLKGPLPKYQSLLAPMLAIVICISFMSDLGNLKYFDDHEKTLMTQVPSQLRNDVPAGSLIHVHARESLSFLPGIYVRDVKELLNEMKSRPISGEYYLKDIACSTSKVWMKPHAELCGQILEKVPMELIHVYTYGSASYSLYRIK